MAARMVVAVEKVAILALKIIITIEQHVLWIGTLSLSRERVFGTRYYTRGSDNSQLFEYRMKLSLIQYIQSPKKLSLVPTS